METPPEQPKPVSTAPGSDLPHQAQTPDPGIADYAHMIQHLFRVGQTLCGQTHGVVDRLSQEVLVVTQEHAQLVLRHQNSSDETSLSSPALAASFSVQFRDRIYGTLSVAPDPAEPTRPALPLPLAHLLAQTCGWLLYTFEVSAFLQGQPQASKQQARTSLTKRERDVLALICRGYDQKALARELSITPGTLSKHRQHIYEKLGVHNEHDAVLAAYLAGLFSPLEEISG